MSQTKSKRGSQWVQCEKCAAYLTSKHMSHHEEFCPQKLDDFEHPFILDQVLYGVLELKQSEDIKNLSSREKDGLVFLSQAAMQLCGFPIGEFVMVEQLAQKAAPLVRKVWPTAGKSLTSVMVTKNGLENSKFEVNDKLRVRTFDKSAASVASQVSVVLLNGPKSMEIGPELNSRICKTYEDRYVTNNSIIHLMFYGTKLQFEVKLIEQSNICQMLEGLSVGAHRKFYLVDDKTKWKIFGTEIAFVESTRTEAHYQVAGLDEETREIRELINAAFKSSSTNGFMHNKSVLLYGNTGTGKTTLAKFIAHTLRVNVVEISATYLYSKNSKSPEETVNKLFKSAIDKSPSRIVEAEKRIISTMLARMDELSQIAAKVFIIATTNKIDQIEPAFRRCGRLDREIEIPTPNPKARKLILRKILSAMSQKVSEAELQEIAMTAHGYVGADLVSVCSQASLLSSRRSVPKIDLDDLKAALRKVRPSAMREVQIETPNVKWTDIGGHSKMKALLSQSVEWPLKYPESFKRLGISPPKGVLMFGPPGCSKTMIAKALATESGLNFITIKGSELFSKWVGESEKAIRDVFRKARQVAPSVVFFDEIDALAGERSSDATTSVQERVLAQLLTELDGITPLADVNILAATNRPDRIDKALIRPGRIDRAVYVALPDADVRRDIFRIQFLKMPTEGVSVEMLVEATQGYSGAEITGICKEAAMFALSEDIQSKCVRMEHFEMALKLAPPRTPPELLKIYDNFVIGAK
ncbi:hypothetical protein D910_08557 [Dendroctonus ponderosae]|uniref:AAA+ ATPase domain-containing protein n=1 Tax=Dendroctonus ponderosae TaxID=77166 RepID=U4UMH4_DENPD|nr:hypothetical protein D910_08557 [Dendroctonus ponderosae]